MRELLTVTVCLFGVIGLPSAAGAEAALDWMVTAYGDGGHNAFTDLVLWQGRYYLCFRHGTAHNSMDGEIRVMRSLDMRTWEPCGTLETFGDDRDPHFTATETALFVYFGTWDLVHGEGHNLPDRGRVRSHLASTTDGQNWSEIQAVYEPGWWLWRVRYHDGAFYSAAYTAVRPRPDVRETRVLRSSDGLEWDLVSTATRARQAGEADMWFESDGSMWLISRTGEQPGHAVRLTSDATRTQWREEDLGILIHSPVLAKWNDRLFVSGRARADGQDKGYVTKIWEIAGVRVEERITLPSGGDTAYPGLVVDPASLDGDVPGLFVTWYSQHDKDSVPNATPDTATVYAGRVSIQP